MREAKDIKIGNYTLEEILERHLHWLNGDCENWENMRADLHDANMNDVDMRDVDMRGANLSGANMGGVNLSYANLSGANMCGVDLSYANMCGVNLSYANLSGANMCGVDMCGVDMRGANMCGANMCSADMRGANLSGTNMCGVYLSGANVRGANMCGADMCGVDLSGANMCGVDLSGADKIRKGIKLSEPIIGWKKCKNDVLVKLEIPRGAIVFSINNKKYRTDKAKVLEIIGGNRAYSKYKFFSYYVGDVIEIFDFNCEYNVECAEGIHFFKTREEAENY